MTYTIELEVRDYECDMHGIVNNGVYLNYYEHARHKFLTSVGTNFKKVTDSGINFVLIRSEIDYSNYLISGDRFSVSVEYSKLSKLKLLFEQEIVLISRLNLDHDDTNLASLGFESKKMIISKSKAIVVALDKNMKPLKIDPSASLGL